MTEVVITGVGAVTPFGVGMPALLAALREGRSAVGVDERLQELGMRGVRSGRVGEIRADFEALAGLDASRRKLFCRFSRMGWLAAMEAWAAPAPSGGVGGVVVGSGVGPVGEIDAQIHAARQGRRVESPGHAVPRVMPSALPCLLAQHVGAELGGHTVSVACNSGLAALAEAHRRVRAGDADWYLVGGVEEDNPFIWRSFDQMRALARAGGEPMSDRCFGFVPAGAAAFVRIESRARAERHGVPILAELAACEHAIGGERFCGFSPRAYRELARRALERAGVDRVDILMPHGNGTPTDPDELVALDAIVRHAAVQLPKARLGHSIGASGLVDVALLTVQLADGEAIAPAPPTCPHPKVATHIAAMSAQPWRCATALKTSHAFGGSLAAAVLRCRS